MNKNPVGEIITFYSYKGGVGRSMALANVAYLLSLREDVSNVLMIDWDLEAPGLHEFFRGRFETADGLTKQLPDGQLGLIDLFYELSSLLSVRQFEDEVLDDIFNQIDIKKYIIKTSHSLLSLMPAGRFDDGLYSTRVSEYNWADFFDNYPGIITRFANYLREKYQYVLVDSRTGYTDVSGICTSIMPEKLVAVFAPNRQNISGVTDMIRRATAYRKQSDDLRPLLVFPLVSRIENAEDDLKKYWRFSNSVKGIEGYQPKFESVLKSIYNLRECDLTKYFDKYKLQYVPKYSYGEELSVLEQRSEDTATLAHDFEKFTAKLISEENSWEESDGVIGEVSVNLKNLQRVSNSTSRTIYQMGMAFFFAVLAFFFYYFGSSSGLFQVLYEFANWQYFNAVVITWLVVDFLWIPRWKAVMERAAKLFTKPWVFTEDNTPQNVPVYPRVLLENFATFSVQSFNLRFGKKSSSPDQPWTQFINSLNNVVFNPEYPSSTLGNILSLFLFASFTLASSIVISNTLSEIGLVSSTLPSIFQRLDYPVLAGTILSLIAGVWMFLELAGISRILDIHKSDVRQKYLLGIIAMSVCAFSLSTIAGISLKQADLLELNNTTFTEFVVLGLPAITTSLGAVLVFNAAVRGFITVLYFLLLVALVILPVLAFLVDISWRTAYISLDFLQWILLTPIIAISHLLNVFSGFFSGDEQNKS